MRFVLVALVLASCRSTAADDVPSTGPHLATFAPSELRASVSGLHFLVLASGGPTRDFAGDDFPVFAKDTIVVVRASLDGKTQWVFPTCSAPGSRGNRIVDGLPSGEAVVVGTFAGSCGTLMSAGDDDGFVTRLDAKGAPLFTARFGGEGVDHAVSARLDPEGNLLLAGTTSGADATSLAIGDVAREFLAKIDRDAHVLWTKQFDGASYKVGAGSHGEAYLFGSFLDGTSFGGPRIERPTPEALALVKLAKDGGFQWARTMRFDRIAGVGPTVPYANDVSIDEDGNVWFAARFGGLSVDVGKGPLVPARTDALTLLVGKLDGAGNPVFAALFDDAGAARLASKRDRGFVLSRTGEGAFVVGHAGDGAVAWRMDLPGATPSGLAWDGEAARWLTTSSEGALLSAHAP